MTYFSSLQNSRSAPSVSTIEVQFPDEQKLRAGFCERLFYRSLAFDLRAGRMQTVLNGKIVDEAVARHLVERARARGWLAAEHPGRREGGFSPLKSDTGEGDAQAMLAAALANGQNLTLGARPLRLASER